MSKVSSKGQVTIPVAIQRKMGMGPGTPVEFELEKDRVVIRKRNQGPPEFDRYFGSLKGLPPTDELMRELRGEEWAEFQRRHGGKKR